jgi:hypothetical protein
MRSFPPPTLFLLVFFIIYPNFILFSNLIKCFGLAPSREQDSQIKNQRNTHCKNYTQQEREEKCRSSPFFPFPSGRRVPEAFFNNSVRLENHITLTDDSPTVLPTEAKAHAVKELAAGIFVKNTSLSVISHKIYPPYFLLKKF